MKKYYFLVIVLLVAITTGCGTSGNNKKTFTHEQAIEKASRYEQDGWIYVHAEGSPEIIGYQHGYLLASEIIDLRKAMAFMDEKMTGKPWSFFREEAMRLYWNKIPVEYQLEIDGIVEGVNAKLGKATIDREDVLAMNADLELPSYYLPWLQSKSEPTPPGRCSAFAATGSWTTDGKIVLAHNNWSNYPVGARWNIILDITPEKGNRIVMDALPGFIHSGDDFFINSAGLVITETTITQFAGYDTTGIPEFVRVRKATQYTTSIDEWAAVMKDGNNGGYANDWLIGDNKTGEVARLELGLKNVVLEKTSDGLLFGSNYPVYDKLIKEETTFDVNDKSSSPNARKLRWEEIEKEYKGKIDIEAAKRFMSDHHDTFLGKDVASGRTLCGHVESDSLGVACWDDRAYFPTGAVQGKATDGSLTSSMRLWAVMGHPCGEAFIASDFLAKHPEYNYMKDVLIDMPSRPWSLFPR
ncbi:MAG: C45 family peptidase [Bacteroidales bacterium]